MKRCWTGIESYFPLHRVRKWYFRHSGIPIFSSRNWKCVDMRVRCKSSTKFWLTDGREQGWIQPSTYLSVPVTMIHITPRKDIFCTRSTVKMSVQLWLFQRAQLCHCQTHDQTNRYKRKRFLFFLVHFFFLLVRTQDPIYSLLSAPLHSSFGWSDLDII